jgi:hypothetical protein
MPEFTRWDDYLVHEHELIERAMAVLRQELDTLADNGHDATRMRRAIDFLLEFGDKVHNAKEEEYLFPRMQTRGVPVEGGPLGVMLKEHEYERELLAHMAGKTAELEDLPAAERTEFRDKGLEYLRIRAEHIWKENDVLYKMANNVLEQGEQDAMLAEFNRTDRETYGEGAHAKYAAMVEEAEKGGEMRRIIHNLSYEQIDALMETLPVEVTFVDADDTVAYFNRLDKEKVFVRTRSVIGRKVEKCHPGKSVDKVRAIVEGFKNRTLDKAEFWIDFRGDKILIRYFPVHSPEGEYMGVLEVTQEIGWIQSLSGQKRLLDQ